MALIDSTIGREKVEIPAHLNVSVTPLGETFGSEDRSGKLDAPSLSTSVLPGAIWHRVGKLARKITHTPCLQDPKQNSLQLWRRQWEEDGNCGQHGCVHCVSLRLSRQRDTWRDLGFLLGGMRARLLSMWFHWWCHLHDYLWEGKLPVPCWACLELFGVSLGFQMKKPWF